MLLRQAYGSAMPDASPAVKVEEALPARSTASLPIPRALQYGLAIILNARAALPKPNARRSGPALVAQRPGLVVGARRDHSRDDRPPVRPRHARRGGRVAGSFA